MRIPIHSLRTVGAVIATAGAILSINPASAQVMSYSPSYAPRYPANIFQPLAPQAAYAYAPAAASRLAYAPRGSSLMNRSCLSRRKRAAAVPPHLRRQIVNYPTREAPGTIIVDTPNTYLYYVLGGGKAVRYGIGVGREGFTWSGVRAIDRKAEWPDWVPPPEMVQRQPYLPRFMAGGEGNPLGARAMYIGGTIYRIHGTNAPSSIGQNVIERLHPHAERGRGGSLRTREARHQGRGAAGRTAQCADRCEPSAAHAAAHADNEQKQRRVLGKSSLQRAGLAPEA